jgi:ubiquinone/menaquinone biosynthesis C-methylase UbiE
VIVNERHHCLNKTEDGETIMESIINYYNSFDEWGRLDREPLEFQVNWHYIKKYLPQNWEILDNGAGPGKYSIELARLGYYVTLTDLTPQLVEMAKEKADELSLTDQFKGFYIADAKDLRQLKDKQFDASLMMGPLYHLQSEEERVAAVKELYRVTKKDGIVFVAFMSRVRHLLSSLLHPQQWKPNNNMNSINEFIETGIFNHDDEGRFTGAYYFNIDDIKPFMESHGFETLNLIGSENIGATLTPEQWEYWRNRGDKEYNKLIDLLKEIATDPYVLGISSHLLYIGRRTG